MTGAVLCMAFYNVLVASFHPAFQARSATSPVGMGKGAAALIAVGCADAQRRAAQPPHDAVQWIAGSIWE